MASIRAIVFDFDGVIALSEPCHFAAFARPAEGRGLAMPEGYFHQMIGRTDEDCAVELAAYWRGDVTKEEILLWKREAYRSIAAEEAQIVPGFPDFLEFLRNKGLRLAIATSSHRSDIGPFLERYSWSKSFNAIHTVDDVSRPKPDPEIYQKAMESLGVNADQTLVFEDSPKGAAAARAAGARLVGMLTSFSAKDLDPCFAAWPDYCDRDLWSSVLI